MTSKTPRIEPRSRLSSTLPLLLPLLGGCGGGLTEVDSTPGDAEAKEAGASLQGNWRRLLTCDVGDRFAVDEDASDPQRIQVVVKNPEAIQYFLRTTGINASALPEKVSLYENDQTMVLGPLNRGAVFSPGELLHVKLPAIGERRASLGWVVLRTEPVGRFGWGFGGCKYDLSLLKPVELPSDNPANEIVARCANDGIRVLRQLFQPANYYLFAVELRDADAVRFFQERGIFTKKGVIGFGHAGIVGDVNGIREPYRSGQARGSGKFITNVTDESIRGNAMDVIAESDGGIRVEQWDGQSNHERRFSDCAWE